MTDCELLQQALDALISVWNCDKTKRQVEAIQAIKTRLAQPEPEPVEYDVNGATVYIKPPLYTAPPKKEWVGLTDADWIIGKRSADYIAGAEWAEAKLKEKNGN